MKRLAQISDLHFGRTDPTIVAALVDELNAQPFDLVIISGDFTQKAGRREFLEAKAFLGRLTAPLFMVPGNHDIPPYNLAERFVYPFRRYKRYISTDLEPCWQDDEIAVIGINTVRRWRLERNWSYGSVNQTQIDRVAEQLKALPPHLFRIVVGHHPFLPPEYAPETRTVLRAERALAVFDENRVGLVLAGHLHRGYARFLKPVMAEGEAVGAEEKPAEGTQAHRLMVAQAGSAVSTRLRDEPNAYNFITVADGAAEIESRVWDGAKWTPAKAAEAAA